MNEQEIKAKRLEILKDTVKYYSQDTNRRAIDRNGNCLYKTNDGRMCAIGRISKNLNSFSNCTGSLITVFHLLEPELIVLGRDFLNYLQELHDFKSNWTEKGLSESGYFSYEKIKKEYCV